MTGYLGRMSVQTMTFSTSRETLFDMEFMLKRASPERKALFSTTFDWWLATMSQ